MLKATPGPWAWVPQHDGDFYYLMSTDGTRVLDDGSACGEYAPVIEPATDPDAHLIAAAPDLYKALDGCAQVLRESAKQFRSLEDHPGHAGIADNFAEIAEAALAKARGEA